MTNDRTANKKSSSDLIATNINRESFKTIFTAFFEKHYGRRFDKTNDYDLMLAEVAFSEAFGWLGDDGKVYR